MFFTLISKDLSPEKFNPYVVFPKNALFGVRKPLS